MAITNDDSTPLIILDTNVLLAATDTSRTSHVEAIKLLNSNKYRLAIAPQMIREYLVAATRPVPLNGLGLKVSDAIANLDEMRKHIDLLAENQSTTSELVELLSQTDTSGKQVHDANVIAVALANNATKVVTDNISDFRRFTHSMVIESIQESVLDIPDS